MTFDEMFASAKTYLEKAKVDATADFAAQVNVTGEGSGIFYVKAADGALDVQPYDYKDHTVSITVDSAVLLDALKNGKAGELQIDGCPKCAPQLQAVLASIPADKAPAKRTRKTTSTTASKTTATKSASTTASKAAAKTTTTKSTTTSKTAAKSTTTKAASTSTAKTAPKATTTTKATETKATETKTTDKATK